MTRRAIPVLRRTTSILAAAAVIAGVTAGAAPAAAQDGFQIVSPQWVATHADDAGLRILDVRTSVADYQQGHIPGAVFLANDALRAPLDGVPVQYLEHEHMAALFSRAGISAGDQVVIYADGKDVLGATMTAYSLQRIGHENVAVLDGGLAAYSEQFPLTQEYPEAPTGSLSPDLDSSIFITLDQLEPLIGQAGVTILDTRPATDYLGNSTRWIRNGHIPGAINIDWRRFTDPQNHHAFKPTDQMRELVQVAGIEEDDDIIVYCGTSREATLVYQILRHTLGYSKVRLYEGSWTEYAATDLPIEREPAGGATVAAAHTPPMTETLEPYECGEVTRLHTIGGIFLASQPSPADFEQAKMGGIRTVINQRHPSEVTDFNERQVVTSLGMTYHNPAWNGPDELTDEVLDETRELLRTAERPVLLHCSSANRTGATWLAYSVLDRGLSWSDALAEAKTVGLKSPEYERIVREYVERRR